MKLVDVKAVYPKYTNTAQSWREYFWQIIVRVETDCGVIGWGYGGGGVGAVEANGPTDQSEPVHRGCSRAGRSDSEGELCRLPYR